MSEQPPLVRQWILLRTLSSRRHGTAVKELAQEMAVGEKTIRRDLETLQAAGFPLRETVEQFGRKKYCLEPTKDQPDVHFSFEEAVALYLGRRFLEPLAGTLFWTAAQSAFKKLRAHLGERPLKYLEKFAPLFHQTSPGASDYSKKAEIIDTLMVGAEDCRSVFITYQSLRATEEVTYDVYPYGLTYHRGSLYLVAFSTQHAAVRHYKVDRIEAAEPGGFPFQRPDDFNLQDHLAKSFGIFEGHGDVHVRIRFTPAVARYVQESAWHPSQRLAAQPDGSLVAEFDLSATEEIKRWVLSFGKEAAVVEPDSLRLELAEEARQIVRAYETLGVAQRKSRPRMAVKPATSAPAASEEGEE